MRVSVLAGVNCFVFFPCALVRVCTIQGDPRSYSLTAPTDPAARARLGRPRAPSVHDTPRPELRELTEMCTVGHNTWATRLQAVQPGFHQFE